MKFYKSWALDLGIFKIDIELILPLRNFYQILIFAQPGSPCLLIFRCNILGLNFRKTTALLTH